MRTRRPAPSSPWPDPAVTTDPAAPPGSGPRPANRAERRAAARGRTPEGSPAGGRAPRSSGRGVRTGPVHTRTDFAARRSG